MPDAPSRSAPAERIGVALCTYNGARYPQAQLDSILDQDLPVNEVMIGDDGSSDRSCSCCRPVPRAQALGIRVEIVQHARNLGYVRNFADALMRCQADILFLCDQDDVWHARACPPLCGALPRRSGLLLLHSDAWLVDAQGAPLSQRLLEVLVVHPAEVELERSGLAIDAILLRNFITGATCALRRGLLPDLPVPPAGATTNGWRSRIAAWRIGHAGRTDHRLPAAWQQPDRCQSPRFPATPASSICSTRRRASARPGACWLWPICWGSAAWWWRRALQGLHALAWRMAWSRLQLYRRADVPAGWIAHDAPP
jgi:hypothetical protein